MKHECAKRETSSTANFLRQSSNSLSNMSLQPNSNKCACQQPLFKRDSASGTSLHPRNPTRPSVSRPHRPRPAQVPARRPVAWHSSPSSCPSSIFGGRRPVDTRKLGFLRYRFRLGVRLAPRLGDYLGLWLGCDERPQGGILLLPRYDNAPPVIERFLRCLWLRCQLGYRLRYRLRPRLRLRYFPLLVLLRW